MSGFDSLFNYEISKNYKKKLKKYLLKIGCSKKDQEKAFSFLGLRFDNQKYVKEAKKFFKSMDMGENPEVIEDIIMELDEIIDDFKFFKTKRGKYIRYINKYLEPLSLKLREEEGYEDLLMGGHTEREVVFITGLLKSKKDLKLIENFISQNPPEYPVEYKVEFKKN